MQPTSSETNMSLVWVRLKLVLDPQNILEETRQTVMSDGYGYHRDIKSKRWKRVQ